MLVRAKVGFAGAFSMFKGQIKECSDNVILQDLLSCGYIEEYIDKTTIEKELVETKEEPKGGTKNESKRSKRK